MPELVPDGVKGGDVRASEEAVQEPDEGDVNFSDNFKGYIYKLSCSMNLL